MHLNEATSTCRCGLHPSLSGLSHNSCAWKQNPHPSLLLVSPSFPVRKRHAYYCSQQPQENELQTILFLLLTLFLTSHAHVILMLKFCRFHTVKDTLRKEAITHLSKSQLTLWPPPCTSPESSYQATMLCSYCLYYCPLPHCRKLLEERICLTTSVSLILSQASLFRKMILHKYYMLMECTSGASQEDFLNT